MSKEKKKLLDISGFEIFRYGFGGLGVNLMYLLVSSFIMYFLTDIAGVSIAAATTMFLISRVTDALFDPVIGTLSDRTVSRWGRYRPYMIFGSIFGVLIFIMLFTVVNFGTTGKVAYYLIVYAVWSIGYTLMVLPYQSLVSVIAKDRNRRNNMVMAGKLFAIPAGLVAVNTLKIVDALGGGPGAWQRLVIIISLVIIPSMWISASAARRFDTKEESEKAMLKSEDKKFTLKEQFGVITKNKALLFLVIAFATNNLADASIKAVQVYFAKYVLEDMSYISTVGTMGILLGIGVFILVPLLARKFAKKDIFIASTILHVMYPIALLFLDPAANIGIITKLAILSGAAGLGCNITAFMMLPDVVDFGKLKTGLRSAGLVVSGFTLSLKASAAIGGSIAGYVLSLVGYEGNEVQSALILTTIVMLMAIPTLLSDIASYVAMRKYPIDERKDDFLAETV